MKFDLKTKLLLTLGAVFLVSFSVLTYIDYRAIQGEVTDAMRNEARSIRQLLMATRRVYRQQFIESGLPLNNKTIGFLPAHALGLISQDFARHDKSGITFDNVSDRPRNPSHAADAVELEAMAFFSANPKVKERLARFETAEGQAYFHYSTPLWVSEACLKCHGKQSDAPPTIRDNYDTGFDYQIGDLRGIVSIKLPAEILAQRTNNQFLKTSISYLAGFLLTFLAVYWFLKSTVLNRLGILTLASEKLANGASDVRVPAEGKDELARVSSAFNSMSVAIQKRELGLRESEQRTRAIFEAAGEGIIVVDTKGVMRSLNPAVSRIFGYEHGEMLGHPLSMLIPREMRAAHEHGFRRCVEQGTCEVIEKGPIEVPGLRKNGEVFPLELNLNEMESHGERLFLGIAQDVTARKKASQALKEERLFLQTVMDGVIDPIMVIDFDHRIRMMNKAARQHVKDVFSETNNNFCFQVSHNRESPCDGKEHPCPLQEVRKTRKPVTVIHEHVTANGDRRIFELEASPLWGKNGELEGIIEASRDITDRLNTEARLRENEIRLAHLAHHDALTGLPNRLLFHDRLGHAMLKAHRVDARVAVLFLDLDRFKNINDSLGHDVGDALLKEVAVRLSDSVREEDTVARLGGDEFVLVLEDLDDTKDIATVARKCLERLRERTQVKGVEIFPSASIGISIFPDDAPDVEGLMKCADAAMYRAKELGRDNYQFYTADMNARTFELLLMEGNLQRALEENQFLLHYQPQYDTLTNELVGTEALVRWLHPEHGMIAPGDFIPLAEDTGLIVRIGRWVLETACLQARNWLDKGLPVTKIAVNLSARQFHQHDLTETVTEALRRAGLPASSLELEITESAVMENPDLAVKHLTALHQQGVKLAIDDFGTGYSSLSYLKRFPIHFLKIDKSFVRDIATDTNDAAIVTSVIALAHSMDLSVIAEGVETREQLAFLNAHGCTLAQGYLFGRPVPAEQFEELLIKRSEVPADTAPSVGVG